MRLHFKPMPGLTLAVMICLPILIGLGVWQYQRWQWKQDVLAEIETAVTAPPLTGLEALADAAGGPVDFRRIQIEGEALGPTWHLYQPSVAIEWQPFRQVRSNDFTALVGFPTFDDRVKATIASPTLNESRAGYVRRIYPRSGAARWFGADSDPSGNRWFEINPNGAWADTGAVYIDLHPTERNASALPIRRPDIPNNHVSYMLTWWSFAIILLLIYGILHHRAGKLSWS